LARFVETFKSFTASRSSRKTLLSVVSNAIVFKKSL
jgi:hypothetical protein